MEGKGRVVLENRDCITLEGALGVLSFDEGFVSVETTLGEVCVEGEKMKIESLAKEESKIVIKGKINSFYYNERRQKRGRRE